MIDPKTNEEFERMCAPYAALEAEAVRDLLDGVPAEGGSLSRATFELVVKTAFQSGVSAVLCGQAQSQKN